VAPQFYQTPTYRSKQSRITKANWLAGKYTKLTSPTITKVCPNPKCSSIFETKPYARQIFCSRRCSAQFHNTGKHMPEIIRNKISKCLKLAGIRPPKQVKLPLVTLTCQNPDCKQIFKVARYLTKSRKYCSSLCAITTIGHQTTSPKASKGKSGVRIDIDPKICFYSTWEANLARTFNLVGIKWQYAPRRFNLGIHTYRPDFYLPKVKTYIEVKNYMNLYSQERDALFRHLFPQIKLEVILKKSYLEIQREYRPLIEDWE